MEGVKTTIDAFIVSLIGDCNIKVQGTLLFLILLIQLLLSVLPREWTQLLTAYEGTAGKAIMIIMVHDNNHYQRF